MGGGKGAVDHYAFPIRPGRIIFEIDGIPGGEAKEALRKAANKLPIKTKIIKSTYQIEIDNLNNERVAEIYKK
jgi:large subunit ribosomal protein L16